MTATKLNELKNITIMCIGTRGDFQPYLALALELKSAGYNVRLLSTITFQKFAQDFGINFVVISDDCVDKTLRENEAMKEAMASGDATKLAENAADTLSNIPFTIETFFQEMTQHTPDLFIEGTLCEYYGHYAKHILNVPSIQVKLQAIVHNPDRAMMGLPTLPDGGHYHIVLQMLEQLYNSWEENYDKVTQSLGYPKLTDVFTKEMYLAGEKIGLSGDKEKIICQSSFFKTILAPGTSDALKYVGPLIIEAERQSANSAPFGGDDIHEKIEAFINAKPESKPIYCGWGSMVCKSPEYMITFVVSALKKSGERGIVLGGVAGLSLDLLQRSTTDEELIAYAKENVLFVEKASHENLFSKVKCVVHHGGAGTTNAALRSGVPSIITPVFFDQYDHAHVLNESGVGFGFSTQFQKITDDELAQAIANVVNNEEMKQRSAKVAATMRAENGQKGVLKAIQEQFNQSKTQAPVVNAVSTKIISALSA